MTAVIIVAAVILVVWLLARRKVRLKAAATANAKAKAAAEGGHAQAGVVVNVYLDGETMESRIVGILRRELGAVVLDGRAVAKVHELDGERLVVDYRLGDAVEAREVRDAS